MIQDLVDSDIDANTELINLQGWFEKFHTKIKMVLEVCKEEGEINFTSILQVSVTHTIGRFLIKDVLSAGMGFGQCSRVCEKTKKSLMGLCLVLWLMVLMLKLRC